MNARIHIPVASDPGPSGGTASGFEGLSTEIQAVAGRRLAGVAVVYGRAKEFG